MVNVHALGGAKMMKAAREAVDASENKPLLIAVTILTSMSEEDVSQVGLAGLPSDNVMRLAELAKNSGMDGVVCSPQETALIREKWPDGALVTPGIRPSWSDKGDQVRIMTPADAVANGSSYLVVGRPITGAEDPMAALARIQSEL
jgi:orotidine-5'-phosphate decarboxylase